jgi:cysteine desulfuration protein SufE
MRFDKGIIAILIRTFQIKLPQTFSEADMDFIDEIGLKEHLSPTRANGLVSMIIKCMLWHSTHKTKN